MQWDKLSDLEFEKAVKDTGVCILATGVVESHYHHLPLGTDYLIAHRIACAAAEKEPAVVFPPCYFGQVFEATCYPGAIAIKPSLLLELFSNIFDEIGRNGFKKIIVYNGHGGNNHFMHFLAQCGLFEEKEYFIYLYTGHSQLKDGEQFRNICDSELHGHACECETSLIMAEFPELVRKDYIPEKAALPINRMKDIPGTFTGIWWYSDYPDYYAGDPKHATPEKGKALFALYVDRLSEYIARVKADKVIPDLNKEFFKKARNPVKI